MDQRLIAIVDYGVSNLHSVERALQHVARPQDRVFICQTPEALTRSDCVVFPGQGAAKVCMEALKGKQDLVRALQQSLQEKPFLGICMGLQVLFDHSPENGGVDCLGSIAGKVHSFVPDAQHKVPHMGWNQITHTQDHPLWHKIPSKSYFYFVHSYYAQCDHTESVVGVTDYGVTFDSAIAENNFFAIQAHPEKSASVGLQFLHNFCRWGV